MSALALGRRVLLLAATLATLAVGVHAASSPALAEASTACTSVQGATGITLCHEGFEIQIFQRSADGRISGRVRLSDGWHPFTVQVSGVKAVVVLIGELRVDPR